MTLYFSNFSSFFENPKNHDFTKKKINFYLFYGFKIFSSIFLQFFSKSKKSALFKNKSIFLFNHFILWVLIFSNLNPKKIDLLTKKDLNFYFYQFCIFYGLIFFQFLI